MAKDDFEDFLSRITFAESRGKRTDSSGKLLEGPMTKYGTAKGELQVLDSTNKKPGYGIVPAKDETPDERARVGRDYLKAMLDKFKDKRTAAIAYNWGPGNTQKWLDAGADEAGLPLETQNYVKKVMGTGVAVAKAPAPSDVAPAPRQAAGAPAVPSSPANRPVVSRETVGPGTQGAQGAQAEDRLSALGPSYQAAMALSYLADTTNPAPQEEDEDGELRISGDEPRSTAREDDDVTNFLTGPSARTALADFDFKIQSPFAERPVKRMAGGGATGGDAEKKSLGERIFRKFQHPPKINPPSSPSPLDIAYEIYKYKTGTFPLENAVSELEYWSKPRPIDTGSVPVGTQFNASDFDSSELDKDKDPKPARRRAKGSPEEGEVSQEELDAASKPSFKAQSSGMNRKRGPISDALTSGEAYTAAAKGFTNLPYNIAGAPMDLAMIVRQGLTGQAPAGQAWTSDWIKNKMTELGIRQAPPTDPTAKGFYELGDLGSNLVNPAAPVRGAVKAAEKTGEAAKMLAKDFQQYNQQLAAPGASYAVRAKGTPVVMSPVPYVSSDSMVDKFILSMDKTEKDAFLTRNPDVKLWGSEQLRNTPEFKDFSTAYFAPKDEVTDLLNRTITQKLAPARMGGPPVSVDPALNNWFSKTFSRYLRSDFASPSDQLVKAADEGKLLHLAPKKLWSDNADDRSLIRYLSEKKSDLRNTREAEGFPKYGMSKTEYGERIEDLTDLSAYPESIGDLSPDKVPISMRGLVATNPETRAMDFSPAMVKNLKLEELRDTMLEIRQSGGQYSAYGQPPAKIPPEFLLPDDTLAKLNVAAASNRVARFTEWQDEIRQGMATTALRTDPRFRRDLSSDGKYVGVSIPDLAKSENQELKKLITDVGCDGGWCTRQEGHAFAYGSGDASLFLLVTNEGKKARPVAQISVEARLPRTKNEYYIISEIAGKNNSYDFADNPALPAIQEYVQNLDSVYGGFEDVANLNKLGMTQIPQEIGKLFNFLKPGGDQLKFLTKFYGSSASGSGTAVEGLRKVADEAVKLNKGSSLVVGNDDTVSELLQQALKNLTTPQPRAQGGFMERQSNDNRKYL